MSNSYNISINQGSSFSLSLEVSDSSGNFLNLSGYVATGLLKLGYGSTGILADLNAFVDQSFVSGIITISIPASITSGLPITKAIYGINAYSSGGYAFQVIGGYADIAPEFNFPC